MNKTLIGTLFVSAAAAMLSPAQSHAQAYVQTMPAEQAAPVVAAVSPMEADIAALQQEWAVIKYQTPSKDKQEEAIEALSNKAALVSQKYPGRAEPLIWQGIIMATEAGIQGGLHGLSDAKSARTILEQAEKIDANALNGSVYTSLGSLYYKVPGFPIGFGDNDKARNYLEKALAMNPDGIDPNFFYGDFLYERGEYARAEQVLNHALQAAPRPGRELADKGRAEETRDLLAKIQQKKG